MTTTDMACTTEGKGSQVPHSQTNTHTDIVLGERKNYDSIFNIVHLHRTGEKRKILDGQGSVLKRPQFRRRNDVVLNCKNVLSRILLHLSAG